MKSRPKILVLGWEFPPLLTGGLGIACYGLSKALAEYADLTVIVPRSDPEFKITQFNLIGLNHIKLEDMSHDNSEISQRQNRDRSLAEVNRERSDNDYHKFAAVHEIEADFDPYPASSLGKLYRGMAHFDPGNSSGSGFTTLTHTQINKSIVLNAAEAEALFSDMDVYGPNIMRKVAAYTEVVCKLSMTLDFDLIHAHDWITYTAAVRIKQLTGKPMVVHVHSLETDRVDTNARNTVYEIERNGMFAADRILPVSNFTRDNIIAHYGIDPGKLSTVYNGIAPVKAYKTDKPVVIKQALEKVDRGQADFVNTNFTPAVARANTASDNLVDLPAEIFNSRFSLEPDFIYRSKEEIYKAAPYSATAMDKTKSGPDQSEADLQDLRISNSAMLESGQLSPEMIKPKDLGKKQALVDSNHPDNFNSLKTEKWVVFLGRVTRQKSPFMMLETARKLVKKMKNVKFFVAGTGDQLGSLKHQVEQEGLEEYFVFTGFISKAEVGLLLSRADVYFMPSISEPFGLSAVEAAQFDVPCVISKQSGVSELLTHALKANFWDTDKFSDLLYAVLNFDGIKETIVGHTRTDLNAITWQNAAKTVSEIYTELIR